MHLMHLFSAFKVTLNCILRHFKIIFFICVSQRKDESEALARFFWRVPLAAAVAFWNPKTRRTQSVFESILNLLKPFEELLHRPAGSLHLAEAEGTPFQFFFQHNGRMCPKLGVLHRGQELGRKEPAHLFKVPVSDLRIVLYQV